MSTDEKRKTLARYRLQQAKESLEEARYLFAGGKSLRSVANRIYYGMFYAVLALLIFEPYTSSKHTGVLAYFNKRFVKGGIFPESMGRTLHKAYDLRQRGDYREYFDISREQVEPLLEGAMRFIVFAETHLAQNVGLAVEQAKD